MRGIVRRIGSQGLSLAGRCDGGPWVPFDTSAAGGGAGAAASPMEVLLLAVGACTAMDVLGILAKKRIKLDDLEVELLAERAETHPRVFTSIELRYHFFGADLAASDLEQSVLLSQEKYCSVAAMLRPSVPMRHAIELHPPRPAR
jgi:putative redox protein